jgi:hypothetical protein
MQIFLSYRRGDVAGHAGRLADALRQRLGAAGPRGAWVATAGPALLDVVPA